MVKQYMSYAFGALGHDAFYATLSTYFAMFVTSVLFVGNGAATDAKLASIVTTMVVVIRLVEIAFDPMIGGIVDNTETKMGKFKPWILGGAIVSSLGLIAIFTSLFGLADSNTTLYFILFAIIFVILDIFYSFKDIAFWSMLPALSVDSKVRNKFGTIGRFGSTIGAQGVAIIIMPMVLFFSQKFSGAHSGTETRAGWLGFAIFIGLISFLGAWATVSGTKENTSLIRENTEKTRLRDVFKVLGENDQLMWLALSYLLFALGYVVTNSLLLYNFQYVLGAATKYSMVGGITTVLGIISVPLFPILVKAITRKGIYVGGIIMMLVGYLLFIFAGTSVVMTLVADAVFFFPYPMIFLAALMTITDSVEYGQWKNGVRNESVTLAVRPLIDKLAGAFSMGIVVLAAVNSGMTGNAKPSDISAHGLFVFHSFMFYMPIVSLILAALIYYFKISLSEKRHAQIVTELEKKLEAQEAEKQN
ncbi:glycoside-pentoside-hexuronide (GPH):cation symporter [Levilactobacillus brevis]|uniref:glycoside-pentoside-hexuronide (GPH):cation symporter n=1 Tax=Levilactobacillus brevis TaxID=1580 RepID=UPI000A20AEDA|nr:glycoside-pentoside-hexuronide (GPH):cation symporter [Levilactobacillus brevis]ARN89486.1 sodium:solute symporter [Levilactobacillus brevis]ARN97055.1 MFS transporter [Levilactobacillus brevis]HJE00544.1 glycoside-pentoside-hexuronide (GPH):cation symporter [Levilactobacillus brevis]